MERPRGEARTHPAPPPGLFAKSWASPGSSRLGYENRLFALLLRITYEVNRAVNSPNHRDADRHQRFLDAAESFDGSDDVEGHAAEVRDRAEYRYHHVLYAVELVMLAESYDGNDIGQSVQREGAEVRDQRHQRKAVGQC